MNQSIIFLFLSCITFGGQDGQPETIRIGTYDNRAIAIAYAASAHNPVSQKMRQLEQAKSEGDEQLVKELEAWGPKHQRELHRQGFGAMPVHNLLAQVKDKIPEVAKAEKLTAIVRQCDFISDKVEMVDVTYQLVMLFQPPEKTLKTIASIKDKPFVDLDEIEKHHDHDRKDK